MLARTEGIVGAVFFNRQGIDETVDRGLILEDPRDPTWLTILSIAPKELRMSHHQRIGWSQQLSLKRSLDPRRKVELLLYVDDLNFFHVLVACRLRLDSAQLVPSRCCGKPEAWDTRGEYHAGQEDPCVGVVPEGQAKCGHDGRTVLGRNEIRSSSVGCTPEDLGTRSLGCRASRRLVTGRIPGAPRGCEGGSGTFFGTMNHSSYAGRVFVVHDPS